MLGSAYRSPDEVETARMAAGKRARVASTRCALPSCSCFRVSLMLARGSPLRARQTGALPVFVTRSQDAYWSLSALAPHQPALVHAQSRTRHH